MFSVAFKELIFCLFYLVGKNCVCKLPALILDVVILMSTGNCVLIMMVLMIVNIEALSNWNVP